MKAIRKRRQRKPMKPTRTAGKSALWRNRRDPAFGSGEQTRRHSLNRKHAQSLLLNLKLREQLRIIGRLKLHSRITKAKPLRLRREINLKHNRGRFYFSL